MDYIRNINHKLAFIGHDDILSFDQIYIEDGMEATYCFCNTPKYNIMLKSLCYIQKIVMCLFLQS